MDDMSVEVVFRSGEVATFVVPKTITLQDFGELAAMVDESGVRQFKVSPPCMIVPIVSAVPSP